jgi:hypothetical protein
VLQRRSAARGVRRLWVRRSELACHHPSPKRQWGHSNRRADVSPPRRAARAEVEEGWTPAGRRKGRTARATAPRRDDRRDMPPRRHYGGHSSHPLPTRQPSAVRRAFHQATEGRCFKCLAKNHRAASCCDPIRCLVCFRSGYHARECRPPPPPPPPPPHTPPPPPPPSSSAMAVGDPHNRP